MSEKQGVVAGAAEYYIERRSDLNPGSRGIFLGRNGPDRMFYAWWERGIFVKMELERLDLLPSESDHTLDL